MIKIYKALILIDKGFIIIRTVLIEKESYLKLYALLCTFCFWYGYLKIYLLKQWFFSQRDTIQR